MAWVEGEYDPDVFNIVQYEFTTTCCPNLVGRFQPSQCTRQRCCWIHNGGIASNAQSHAKF
eukprot:scaffold117911_cov46-Cyclotella_meneghiniana.AAC.2